MNFLAYHQRDPIVVLVTMVEGQEYVDFSKQETAGSAMGLAAAYVDGRLVGRQDYQLAGCVACGVPPEERVVGVLLIAAGSMLNGYGVAIARPVSLKGP